MSDISVAQKIGYSKHAKKLLKKYGDNYFHELGLKSFQARLEEMKPKGKPIEFNGRFRKMKEL